MHIVSITKYSSILGLTVIVHLRDGVSTTPDITEEAYVPVLTRAYNREIIIYSNNSYIQLNILRGY
ncbi:hypothetical protein C0J52_14790 [Blattella germanica]|nr:hypothetical protein C0J52_14790 [Blattella germanica]